MKPKMSLIRFYRLAHGLTLVEVGREIGVSAAKLSLIERGLQEPLMVEVEKLSEVLDLNADLLKGEKFKIQVQLNREE
jgi:transcriptional regulator with XRE-family HTH domain